MPRQALAQAEKKSFHRQVLERAPFQERIVNACNSLSRNKFQFLRFKPDQSQQYLYRATVCYDGKLTETQYFYVDKSRKIAEGGFGFVYPAFKVFDDGRLGEKFILKVEKKPENPQREKETREIRGIRFWNEVNIQSHNLKTAVCIIGSEKLIFTGYLPGNEITKESIKNLSFIQRLNLIIELLGQLRSFHSHTEWCAPFIHGDINRYNIRFQTVGKVEIETVHAGFIDYGLSAWLDEANLDLGFNGTHDRIAPETKYYVRTTASDIYSFLNIMLFLFGVFEKRSDYKSAVFKETYLNCSNKYSFQLEGYVPYSFEGIFSNPMKNGPDEEAKRKLVKLLKRMQAFDPDKRPTAAKCLRELVDLRNAEVIKAAARAREEGDDDNIASETVDESISKELASKSDDIEKKIKVARLYMAINHIMKALENMQHFTDENRFGVLESLVSSFNQNNHGLIDAVLSSSTPLTPYNAYKGNEDNEIKVSDNERNIAEAITSLYFTDRRFKGHARLFTAYLLEQVFSDKDFCDRMAALNNHFEYVALILLKLPQSYQLNILRQLPDSKYKNSICRSIQACRLSPIKEELEQLVAAKESNVASGFFRAPAGNAGNDPYDLFLIADLLNEALRHKLSPETLVRVLLSHDDTGIEHVDMLLDERNIVGKYFREQFVPWMWPKIELDSIDKVFRDARRAIISDFCSQVPA